MFILCTKTLANISDNAKLHSQLLESKLKIILDVQVRRERDGGGFMNKRISAA